MYEIYFKDIKVPKGGEYFWIKLLKNNAGKEYFLHTSGIVGVRYKNGKERMLKSWLNSNGDAMVRVSTKQYKLKNLVAKAVFLYYKKGLAVLHKDRNAMNCDYKNLIVTTPSKLGKATGHLANKSMPVKAFIGGEWCRFRSVRQGAKALGWSYQTLLDYLNGKHKNAFLEKHKVEYIKKEVAI